MNYLKTNDTLTIEIDGWIATITSDHPHFTHITEALESGEDAGIEFMVDLTRAVAEKADGEIIKVEDGNVFVNGEVAEGAIANQIRDFIADGLDFEPLLNFYRRIEANPSQRSRENLHEWLATHDFTITRDGQIVGYKSVNVERDDDGGEVFGSIRKGYGIVNGVEIEHGSLPQVPGTVVEMPRNMVDADPNVTCSTGLHVATKDYADGFGGGGTVTVLVKVDPADVVAVPGDYQRQKMRACKYEVIGKCIDQPLGRLFAEDFGVAMVTDNEVMAEAVLV